MAPENNTAGKHNIGRASVACATFPTAAEVSRPRPRAATAHSSSPNPIEAYVDSERPGRRSSRRSTASIATTTKRRNGTRIVTFDATYAPSRRPTRRSRRRIVRSVQIWSKP